MTTEVDCAMTEIHVSISFSCEGNHHGGGNKQHGAAGRLPGGWFEMAGKRCS